MSLQSRLCLYGFPYIQRWGRRKRNIQTLSYPIFLPREGTMDEDDNEFSRRRTVCSHKCFADNGKWFTIFVT